MTNVARSAHRSVPGTRARTRRRCALRSILSRGSEARGRDVFTAGAPVLGRAVVSAPALSSAANKPKATKSSATTNIFMVPLHDNGTKRLSSVFPRRGRNVMAGRSCPRQSPGPPCVPNGFGHAVVLIKAGVGGEQGEQRNGEDQQQGRSALARCGGRGSGW